jgi:DNA repair exonuclease SbcCD ATPase subunit
MATTDLEVKTVPDPSTLTTDAIERAAKAERDYVNAQLDVLRQRLTGMDEATKVLNETVTRTPTEIQKEVTHLRELSEEKFQSVANQFAERDVRSTQQTASSDQALAAALQAAKELVGAQGEASAAAAVKSETSFTKQIDQIGTIIQTLEKALDARITELKERIDRGEGNTTGRTETRTDFRASANLLVGVVGAVIAALVLVIGLYATFHK